MEETELSDNMYFGEECPKCGNTVRYKIGNFCIVCRKQIQKKARDKYAENNPDKIKAQYKKWYDNNKDHIAEYKERNKERDKKRRMEYYWENVEREREKVHQWYLENKEHVSEYNRQYRQENEEFVREAQRKWREENPDYGSSWKKQNRDKVRAYDVIRRTRILNQGGTYTPEEWYELCEVYDFRCLCCEDEFDFYDLTVDHIIPVAKGGTSDIDNLQPLCMECNLRKGTKIIDYR
jgi:5-methylcytosine-specific restriction endonuclease McrA